MTAATACPPSTVVVVDDDKDVRESIRWTLSNLGMNVQAFENAQSCLAQLDPHKPTCLVVDLLLPGMTGIHLCEQLRSINACFEFVVITGFGDVPSAVSAMKLGAVDFIEKPIGRERLVQTVNHALEMVNRRHAAVGSEEEIAVRFDRLSSREREVFEHVANGLVSKQIASLLGISVKTVDVHRSNIMRKLKVESPTQLACVICVLRRREERLA